MSERKTMPLSNREHNAFMILWGMVNAFTEYIDVLHTRCNMIDGCWRDMKLIGKKSTTAMQDIMYTIPPKKLAAMKKDLEHVVCEVRVAYDYAKKDDREFTYSPTEALDRLVDIVIKWECLSCDKTAKEAKKCPVFKAIDDCYSWTYPPQGNLCPFAGMTGD